MSIVSTEGARQRGWLGIRGTVLYPLAFFFLFMGGGAFQQFYITGVAHLTSIDSVKASMLLATVYFAFTASRLLVGSIAYALGEYAVLVLSGLTYAVFPLSLLLFRQFGSLLACAALLGVGASFIHTVTPSLMLDAGDRHNRRGRSVGSLYFWLSVGFAIGVAVYAALQPSQDSPDLAQGYRRMAALAAVITVAGVACLLAAPHRIPKRDFPTVTRFIEVMRTRGAWLLATIICGSAVSYGLMLSIFFDAISGSVATKAVGLAGFYVARIVLTYVSGRLSDHMRRSTLLSIAFFIASSGLFLAAFVRQPWAWAVASIALGIQAGTTVVVPAAIVGDWASRGRRHIALSSIFVWSTLGMGLTISLGPPLRRAFGDSPWTWIIFAAILGGLGFLSTMLERPADKEVVS